MAEVMIFPSYGKGYGAAGASYQRRALRGMIAKSGSPREDIDLNNQTLRERSRMLYMAGCTDRKQCDQDAADECNRIGAENESQDRPRTAASEQGGGRNLGKKRESRIFYLGR